MSDFEKCITVKLGGRGWGVVFACGKFKFELFLNDLWHEIFVTFTRNYFAEKKKKMKKIIDFQEVTYFLPGELSKNRSSHMLEVF